MGFDAVIAVSAGNGTPAEAAGRLAAVFVASCFVAFLLLFFAIVVRHIVAGTPLQYCG